ncbi:hypothetical protein COB57_03835 [Candidatus Peregrinibacteria bacterium]|nr:MAG: hypothetical protein COB57_03835 [Candidatus Peregrinibacteria bacterium]
MDLNNISMGEGQEQQQEGITESVREAYREKQQETKSAAKKAKKEEGAIKIHNSHLSAIMTYLLQSDKDNVFIILISQLISNNIPSDFIVAVLSLYFNKYLIKEVEGGSSDYNEFLAVSKFISDDDAAKKDIDIWMQSMICVAKKDSQDLAETIIEISSWQVHPALISLSVEVMRQFSIKKSISFDEDKVSEGFHKFFSFIFEKIQHKIS